MTFLYRGVKVSELIEELSEMDKDMYVVLRGFDHSYDHRIALDVEWAEIENGRLSQSNSNIETDAVFKVVVIS